MYIYIFFQCDILISIKLMHMLTIELETKQHLCIILTHYKIKSTYKDFKNESRKKLLRNIFNYRYFSYKYFYTKSYCFI